jgi:hypothetical protein
VPFVIGALSPFFSIFFSSLPAPLSLAARILYMSLSRLPVTDCVSTGQSSAKKSLRRLSAKCSSTKMKRQ